MTLTPEKIAEYEARAKAGEKPKHTGWKGCINYDSDDNLALSCSAWLESPDGRKLFDMATRRGPFEDFWSLRIGNRHCNGTENALKLAAEDLLREATAPLWEGIIRNLLIALEETHECGGALDNFAIDVRARAESMLPKEPSHD